MKTKLTVKSLRASGHLVKVSHIRRVAVSKKTLIELARPKFQHIAKGKFDLDPIQVKPIVLSKGGETQLTVDTKGGKHYHVTTVCSRREVYNK